AVDTAELPLGTTAGNALELLAVKGSALLTEAVDTLATNPQAGTPQVGTPSYAHKLTRADGKLDPKQGIRSFLSQWAGVTPEPGAYVECEGQALKLHEIAPVTTEQLLPGVDLQPGHAAIIDKRAVLATSD